jgi:hypothetical protein
MIVLQKNEKKELGPREFPTMTREELEHAWRQASEYFQQARTQKMAVDRVYQAAAIELNAIERLIQKMEQRDAVARRTAERASRTSTPSRR